MPRVLEPAASKAAHSTALGSENPNPNPNSNPNHVCPSQASTTLTLTLTLTRPGVDVARKALILARCLGMQLELGQVR